MSDFPPFKKPSLYEEVPTTSTNTATVIPAPSRPRMKELWVNPDGFLVLCEWNLCGCHPNDVIKTRFDRYKNRVVSFSYTEISRGSHTRRAKNRGWIRLEVFE